MKYFNHQCSCILSNILIILKSCYPMRGAFRINVFRPFLSVLSMRFSCSKLYALSALVITCTTYNRKSIVTNWEYAKMHTRIATCLPFKYMWSSVIVKLMFLCWLYLNLCCVSWVIIQSANRLLISFRTGWSPQQQCQILTLSGKL
jgi:hypothetical protein